MLKDIFTPRQSSKTTTTTHLSASAEMAENPYIERVVLPDGQVMVVARGSLAAAKGVVAARKAALRRMAEQTQDGHENVIAWDRPAKIQRAS